MKKMEAEMSRSVKKTLRRILRKIRGSNSHKEPVKKTDMIGRIAKKSGLGREEVEAMLNEAKFERRIPFKVYEKYGFYKLTKEEQDEKFRELLEERKKSAGENLNYVIKKSKMDPEEAILLMVEAKADRGIFYWEYANNKLWNLTPDEQDQLIKERRIERKANKLRKEFVKNSNANPVAPEPVAPIADPDEFAKKNADLKYLNGTRDKHPDGIIAAAYYLGYPLPEYATLEYQPSAYVGPIDGSFEGLQRLLGEDMFPDTAKMHEFYETFIWKYKLMEDLNFNETDLAIYFTDWYLHGLDYGYRHKDYFDFDFYKSEFDQRLKFISTGAYKMYVNGLCTKGVALFKDKGKFNRKFRKLVNREWIDGRKCTFDEFKDFASRNDVFFAKPIEGTGGHGAHKVRLSEFSSLEEAYDLIKEEGDICEELVIQHPDIAAFNPDTLNTLRIYTLLGVDDVAVIPGAFARFGRKGNDVDNFHSGGMGAAVDPDTGIIFTDAVDLKGLKYTHHPDSGLQFKGFQVPEWQKIKDTVQKACVIAAPKARHLGWDISVTKYGDIEIVEANTLPNFDFLQAVDKIGKFDIYDRVLTPLAERDGVKVYRPTHPDLRAEVMSAPTAK